MGADVCDASVDRWLWTDTAKDKDARLRGLSEDDRWLIFCCLKCRIHNNENYVSYCIYGSRMHCVRSSNVCFLTIFCRHGTLSTMSTTADPSSTPQRRPRVLLGVTGSVAAVKGPELAVRLTRDVHCDVRVLLTAGGSNFWFKAQDYDPNNWKELEKCNVNDEESDSWEGKIHIHSELLPYCGTTRSS